MTCCGRSSVLIGRQLVLAETPPYEIPVIDLTDVPGEGEEPGLSRIREEMSHQSLSPERWPMFDIRVSALSSGRLRLHMNIDNVIADAASLDVFFRDWRRFYENPTVDAGAPRAVLPGLRARPGGAAA